MLIQMEPTAFTDFPMNVAIYPKDISCSGKFAEQRSEPDGSWHGFSKLRSSRLQATFADRDRVGTAGVVVEGAAR
jgi:hypothetical protein